MQNVTVATHDGLFHVDDVVAVAIIKNFWDVLTDLRGEVKVVRTRNPQSLAKADIVLDVGAVYDPAKGRYDHHQRGGAGSRENGVPYATAGLVWKAFGAMICNCEFVAQLVDQTLIQGIDALDTGVRLTSEIVQGSIPFATILDVLNPGWHEELEKDVLWRTSTPWHEEGDFDTAFGQAVDNAQTMLARTIERAQGYLLAQEVVRKAISETEEDLRVIVMHGFAPGQETVITEALNTLVAARSWLGGRTLVAARSWLGGEMANSRP
jgi:uncharacterized UPF0160 family protein